MPQLDTIDAVTIRLPAGLLRRAEAAFAAAYSFTPATGKGPQNSAEFLRAKLRAYVLEVLGNHEIEEAGKVARKIKTDELVTEFEAATAEADAGNPVTGP